MNLKSMSLFGTSIKKQKITGKIHNQNTITYAKRLSDDSRFFFIITTCFIYTPVITSLYHLFHSSEIICDNKLNSREF
jgi:hypothetical protein